MREINKAVPKKDAYSLLLGKPVYTDDLAPKDALVVKLLRSKVAYARIKNIDKAAAMKVPGIAAVYTREDVPKTRFCIAGQSFPETSPYDRLILDEYVRYVGDAAAIVAGDCEEAVDKALKLLKVDYETLEPVLDFEKALDNPSVIHTEEDAICTLGLGYDKKRNLVATDGTQNGDVEKKLSECRYVVDRTYYTKKFQQCQAETFRAFSRIDETGRLIVTASTQVPFHVRRILARALEMKESQIRVVKPRIGGGFGSKQSVLCEIYAAFVTMKTGRPAKIVFDRYENFEAGNPRHAMRIRVRAGADENGIIRAIDQEVLSDTGAYGEHGFATVGLAGRQPLGIYRFVKDYRFRGTVVYTNTTPCGAYRGFGNTQGCYAVESAINELCEMMEADPVEIRLKNAVCEGDHLGAYGQMNSSCALTECIKKCAEDFRWKEKRALKVTADGKLHGAGVAMTMQDSGIAGIDTASASIRLIEDGSYILRIGATDMGTGCDTILAQIAAECLGCPVDSVRTLGVDTDNSPYDTGSYASSTTFVTGGAVVKACEGLKRRLLEFAAEQMNLQTETEGEASQQPEEKERTAGEAAGQQVEETGRRPIQPEQLEYLSDSIEGCGRRISLVELAHAAMVGNAMILTEMASNSLPVSPPPFMVGMAEVEIDPDTGDVKIPEYTAYVDCGTVINKALARVQTEGAIMQGIGMALTENVMYSEEGRLITNSFMTYGIPTRLDVPAIKVGFCESYEQAGPFGAKSIGEVTINTSAPAIVEAIANATGKRFRSIPVKSESIVMGKE